MNTGIFGRRGPVNTIESLVGMLGLGLFPFPSLVGAFGSASSTFAVVSFYFPLVRVRVRRFRFISLLSGGFDQQEEPKGKNNFLFLLLLVDPGQKLKRKKKKSLRKKLAVFK